MTSEILARINNDKTEARLIIKPGFDQSMVTPMTLLAIAADAGLQIGANVEEAVNEFVPKYVPSSEDIEVVIASAVLPQRGNDGWIEWRKGFDPDYSTDSDQDENTKMDHYLGKKYIEVLPDDVLGIFHKPTIGSDGRDVLGGCLKSVPGKDLPIKFDSTVRLNSDGEIIANAKGAISFQNDLLEIVQLLIVPDCVDFSSGHIDFTGSVTIRNAIRTGFNVNVEGDVQVGGLIEASLVSCRGDLTAKQGMAGKGRGALEVGGNVVAAYLEEVRGTIRGDLVIRNSLIGCKLEIHGDVDIGSGVIRGGTLNIAGTLKAKVLGAASSPPTRIFLGQVPKLQESLDAAQKQLQDIKNALEKCKTEYDALSKNKSMDNSDKERMTELVFEKEELDSLLVEKIKTINQVSSSVEDFQKFNVQVLGFIHHGVELVVGEQLIAFSRVVAGPVTVFRNDKNQILYKAGSGESKPIETIAKVTSYQDDLAA